jgi:hypothetical protein
MKHLHGIFNVHTIKRDDYAPSFEVYVVAWMFTLPPAAGATSTSSLSEGIEECILLNVGLPLMLCCIIFRVSIWPKSGSNQPIQTSNSWVLCQRVELYVMVLPITTGAKWALMGRSESHVIFSPERLWARSMRWPNRLRIRPKYVAIVHLKVYILHILNKSSR